MRRAALIVLALAALITAVAAGPPAAQSQESRSRTHRKSSHRETSRGRHTARTRTVRSSRRSGERAEEYPHERRSRYAAEHRASDAAENSARYEEGYQAGYAAGRAYGRKELVDETECHVSSRRPLRSGELSETAALAPEKATQPVVARSQAPMAPTSPSLSGNEPAAMETLPTRRPPMTLEASLRMMQEPLPPPLRGSLASLERQNQRLDAEGLQRIEDDSDLEYRISRKLLVPLPASAALTVNPSLPVLRRYCRPWTAEFLTDLARMHEELFHRPLEIDSAVRPVDYQRRLMEINGNAAPAEGDIVSPHETGAAIDIAKRGMTLQEIGWMRRWLLALQNDGLIDVEEEFEQACFHITVYKSYAPARTPGGTTRAGTALHRGHRRTEGTAIAATSQGQ